MDLKVIYINRKKLDLENEARELWEQVLKPKWERRFRECAEKLLISPEVHGDTSAKEFTIRKETIEPSEKLEIVIEVDGNRLNIRCSSKTEIKNSHPNCDQISDQKYPLTTK